MKLKITLCVKQSVFNLPGYVFPQGKVEKPPFKYPSKYTQSKVVVQLLPSGPSVLHEITTTVLGRKYDFLT